MRLDIVLKSKSSNLKVDRNLSFSFSRGDDFLSMLDKFLKKNKIDLNELLSISVDCENEENSISCKIAKSSVEAFNFSIKK